MYGIHAFHVAGTCPYPPNDECYNDLRPYLHGNCVMSMSIGYLAKYPMFESQRWFVDTCRRFVETAFGRQPIPNALLTPLGQRIAALLSEDGQKEATYSNI